MHLVVVTREDPQLPLARLRARSQLTELRAADLRFTPSEAAEFLNAVMGLTLSTADVAALEDRTEGWIAGLQLAALSLKDHHDVSGFIRAFAGDHRYIVDYLVEEVLRRQPGRSATSCCRPLFSTGYTVRSAMPSRARRRAPRDWSPWSAATSSSSRWMIGDNGFAITTSLPTCSWRTCWPSGRTR